MRLHFHGGKFDGCKLNVAAPYVPTKLYVVKAPPPATQLEVLIVGTERTAPGPMFPDAIEYTLDREASNLRDHPEFEGMEIGDAEYRA